MNEAAVLTDAQEMVFSAGTLLGYGITGVLYILLPIIAFLLMYKYKAARIFPVFIGILVYFLSTKMCDLSVWIFFSSVPYAVKAALSVEFVGIFEETGRWLAIKYPVFNLKTAEKAICCGIGHAGLECWIRGVQSFKLINIGQELNLRGLSAFNEGKTKIQAEEITRQLSSYANRNLFISLLDSVNIITNFGMHIALTLFIFRRLQKDSRDKKCLILAILLHAAHNEISGLASLSGSMIISSLISIATGIAVIVFVMKKIDGRAIIDDIIYPEI